MYSRIGGVRAGQAIEIVARNPAGDWYQLANGSWIFGSLVENAPEVPVAASIPAPPAATPSPKPAAPTANPLSTKTSVAPKQVLTRVRTNANLRAGPGTNYLKVGDAKAGQTLAIVGQNTAGDWYQTATGAWIFGELLDGSATVPVVSGIPDPPSITATPAVATPVSAVRGNDGGSGPVGRVHLPGCSFDSPRACVDWLLADLAPHSFSVLPAATSSLPVWGCGSPRLC